jgi:hypothetical protein
LNPVKLVIRAAILALKLVNDILDPYFIYMSVYMVLNVMALYIHPFIWSFHMVDYIVKSPELISVLMSIWEPIHDIKWALIMIFLIQYWTTIVTYSSFYTYYVGTEDNIGGYYW